MSGKNIRKTRVVDAQSLRSWVPLGETKASSTTKPSARFLTTLEGLRRPLAYTRSPRLRATPPGATPAELCEHTTRVRNRTHK